MTEALWRNFVYENMILWAVVGVVHAVEFHRRAQEREAHAARLRAELVQARLDALAGQLRPHFLFNALHTVSSLMHRDVDAADAVLARLGDLLRRTLRRGEAHELPLGEELAMLDDYLAIAAERFRDRLTVDVRAEPGTGSALVPSFVLQPLVENALEHGIARRAGAGRVEVRAARVATPLGDELRVTVADDGPGFAQGVAGGNGERDGDGGGGGGIGLTNTRRRLAALYGDRQRLVLTDRPGGGLVVTLDLPFHEAAERPDGELALARGA
jgi:LytS/YehU family sensor histidine kinase